MKTTISLFALIFIIGCQTKVNPPVNQEFLTFQKHTPLQDTIIKEHLENGAWTKALYSKEWQEEIDKGLAKDSTIAYLWQQKAMPLFKQGKYELGMDYIDKAVKYNRNVWQEYRACIKCIFAKTYRDAIADFEDCKLRQGNSYVMDHAYDFYIALSKIQLNEYSEAEALLEKEVKRQVDNQGEEWVHHLDLFYLGIAKLEQAKYEKAIRDFNKALKLYPEFSEVLYYKSDCLRRLGQSAKADKLLKETKKFGKLGYT
ncbi:MAG: tetratricopeptide repeat protein, partial [Bacteroidia bacterium]|nr:tetratricopeptide repeat protein [Bacteroidia bacterium]